MNTSKKIGIVITILVVIILIFLLKKPAAAPAPQESATQSESALIENQVTGFGKAMQQVSLLAPSDALKSSMESAYGAYVAPELLAAWEADPSAAPGRETSSPWPDHIVITSTQMVGTQKAVVSGMVIELTSNEVARDGIANQYPVTITLEERGGVWVITDFKK